MIRRFLPVFGSFFIMASVIAPAVAPADEPAENKIRPIPIASVQHTGPVDFEKEILPIFSSSCLACHNRTKAKSGLLLETPADIRKGCEDGTIVVVPGKSAESLLLKAAGHDPSCDAPMPPPNNKVAAADLSPSQLGLIKLWIDQGATGQVRGLQAPVKWQPMPSLLDPIYAVALTPDGHFAAAGRANRIDVYDLSAGKLAGSMIDPRLASSGAIAHRDMVESLAFSPDGNLLASGSFREVKIWRQNSSGEKLVLGDKPATFVAVAPDGKRMATAGKDGVIRLWDLATGKPGGEISDGATVSAYLQFSPNGSRILSLADDHFIRVFDLTAGNLYCKMEADARPRCAAWVGNQAIAIGTDKGDAIGWTLPAKADGKAIIGKPFKDGDSPITAIAGVPADESHFLFAHEDGRVSRGSLASGSLKAVLKIRGSLSALLIRPDYKRLVTLGDSGARIWSVDDAKMIAELKGDPASAMAIGAANRELSLAKNEVTYRQNRLDAAQKQSATAADRAKRAREAMGVAQSAFGDAQKAYDAAKTASDDARNDSSDKSDPVAAKTIANDKTTNDKLAKALETADADLKKAQRARDAADDEVKLAGRDEQDSAIALTEAGPLLNSAIDRVKLREKDAENARQNLVSDRPIKAIALSADGALIATAGDDGIVRTWSSEKGSPGQTIPGTGNVVESLALIGRNRVVCCGANTPPTILTPSTTWNLERTIGTTDSTLPFIDRVTALDFSPDGKWLAAGSGVPSRSGDIRIFEVATGNLKAGFDNVHSDTVSCLRFSPEGSRLASASADRLVRLLDPTNGKVIRALEGHSGQALSVAWSHDGHTLASTGADNTLRFWDAENGQRGKVVEGFDKEVTGVCFVGDDAQTAVTTGDGKLRLIKADGTDVRGFGGATDFLYSLAASIDGTTLIAGGQDGVLRAWDVATGQPSGTYKSPGPEK